MGNKKKRILKLLYQRMSHDPHSYNPNWKWEWLPKEVRENYTLIRPKLKEWEEIGYIELIEHDDVFIRIIEVPPNLD